MGTWLAKVRHGLIASCQALPNEPLYGSEIMAKMAKAAEEGGAAAIRANGADDVAAIKQAVTLPVIGLVKRDYEDSEVYITPTAKEVEELRAAGADMIALDATLRIRPGKETLEALIRQIKRFGLPVMADVSTLEEALHAESLGADCVSTTLSGYTPYSPKLEGPDFALVGSASGILSIPLIAEGRISQPSEVEKMLGLGAYAVVVGSAISRPQLITRRFASAAKKAVNMIYGNESKN